MLDLEAREVPATGLGVANDYSAFVLHDADLFNSDVEGRVAIGGNAKITAYAIGDHVANSFGTRNDLIIGGNADLSNGQVFEGNAVYGGTGNIAQNFGHPNGTITQQSGVIDFAAAEQSLDALSDQYAGMAATGNYVNSYGTIILNGKAGQNVFNVPASVLWTANDLQINAPAGATAIVNITGNAAQLQFMGYHLNGGIDKDGVILNFPQATQVTLQGIGIFGNVLAPRAHVDFNNGQINGTLVAGSWCGYGQVNFPQQPPCMTPPPPPPPPCPPPPPPPPVCPPPPPPPVCPPPPPPPVCNPPPPPPPVCPPPPPPPPVCPPPPPPCNSLPPSKVSGLVYVDANQDGMAQDNEMRLTGVTVTLAGTDSSGHQVSENATTDSGGIYTFDGLTAGTYTINATTPAGYTAGQATAGGAFGGTAGANVVTNVVIPQGQSSGGYNFGEITVNCPVTPPPPCNPPPPPPPPPCPPPPPPCNPPPPPVCEPPPPPPPPVCPPPPPPVCPPPPPPPSPCHSQWNGHSSDGGNGSHGGWQGNWNSQGNSHSQSSGWSWGHGWHRWN